MPPDHKKEAWAAPGDRRAPLGRTVTETIMRVVPPRNAAEPITAYAWNGGRTQSPEGKKGRSWMLAKLAGEIRGGNMAWEIRGVLRKIKYFQVVWLRIGIVRFERRRNSRIGTGGRALGSQDLTQGSALDD